MDLKQFFVELKDNPPEFDRIFRIATEWRSRTLRYYPKPTIAMVNGYCFGGAFSIVEGCDLAFAAKEAMFGLSEINFKHFPGGSVSKSLANLLRPRDALYYAMTGRTFKGDRAAEIGFVNAAYPLADLKKEVMALAKEIASKDPDALTACKDGYRFSLEMSAKPRSTSPRRSPTSSRCGRTTAGAAKASAISWRASTGRGSAGTKPAPSYLGAKTV